MTATQEVEIPNINKNIIGTIYLARHLPPVRAYVHSSCLGVYGSDQQHTVCGARDHLVEVLVNYPSLKDKNYSVITAVLRAGQQKSRIIDFFGFVQVEKWPGNPQVDVMVFEDSDDSPILLPSPNVLEDTLVILDQEISYRRATSSLEEFLRLSPPSKLLGLEQIFKRTHLVVDN